MQTTLSTLYSFYPKTQNVSRLKENEAPVVLLKVLLHSNFAIETEWYKLRSPISVKVNTCYSPALDNPFREKKAEGTGFPNTDRTRL